MAEIARLGMQVDATGVTQMRQELLALASSAAQAAKQIEASGGAVERTGEKFGSPIGGFMEFSNQATRADRSVKTVARTLAVGTVGMLDFGAAGNAAAGALNALLTGAGPAGIALAGVAVVLSLASDAMASFRENAQKAAEQDLKAIEKETENLKADLDIRKELKILEALNPELERIKIKYSDLTDAAQKRGATEDQLARIERRRQIDITQAQDAQLKKLDQQAAAKQAIVDEINTARANATATGASAEQTAALALAQKLAAIETRALTSEFKQELQLLAEIEKGTFAFNQAQARIQSGRQGFGDFQSQFGVNFDFQSKAAGNDLADKFSVMFNNFKDDPRAQGTLAQAFGSLVTQGIQQGVPDIPELLVSKIGSANFERLRAGLGDDLRNALDSTTQAGQQWGATFRAEFVDMTARLGNVGTALRAIDTEYSNLTTTVAQQMAVNIDVNSALSEFQKIQIAHQALRAQLMVPIPMVIQTNATGSPTMSFSDYFDKYLPGKLDGISALSPEIAVNLPGFSEKVARLRQISQQEDQLRRSFTVNDVMSASPIARLNRELGAPLLQRLSEEAEHIRFELGLEATRAQQQRGGSSGGGSGAPPVVVNLDLTGATLSREFLDEEMIPAIERGIIRATGQYPKFRVEN